MRAPILHYMSVDYHLLKRKTKRKNGTTRTVYYVGFLSEERKSPSEDGRKGKQKYRAIKSTGAGNKALANKIARRMLEDGTVFSAKDNLKNFLLDFWDPKKSEYLKSRKAEDGKVYSAKYLETNATYIKANFLPFCESRGISRLCDLTPKNLLQWRNWARFDKPHKRDPKKKGLSPRVVNMTRQAVWVPLNWAVDMRMVPYHPGGPVKPVKENLAERTIFEIAEIQKLFAVPWADARVYAACIFALGTGARLGETRGLLFANLHLDQGYVDILRNWQDLEGLKQPKRGSERVGVPLPERVVETLYMLNKINRWGKGPDNFVFFDANSPKLPISKTVIYQHLKNAIHKAGLPSGRSFQSFRHTFISHVSGQLSPAALRYHVGHSNPKTTQRYEHVTERDKLALSNIQNNMLRTTD